MWISEARSQSRPLSLEQNILPDTDTNATVNCRHFTRPNENQNNEIELVPDVVLNLSDYTMDKDPAWDWIIKHYTL